MKLATAAARFAKTPIDGLNVTDPLNPVWDPEIAHFDFLTYQRWIASRDFGQRKRLIYGPREIPAGYYVVRTPDGAEWIVEAHNSDIGDWSVQHYGNTYQIRRASFLADIQCYNTLTSASGVKIGSTPIIKRNVPVDHERFGQYRSDEFEEILSTRYTITMPGDTMVDKDAEIIVAGKTYAVDESYPTLLSVTALCTLRGTPRLDRDGNP